MYSVLTITQAMEKCSERHQKSIETSLLAFKVDYEVGHKTKKKALELEFQSLFLVVRPTGFEPATFRVGV